MDSDFQIINFCSEQFPSRLRFPLARAQKRKYSRLNKYRPLFFYRPFSLSVDPLSLRWVATAVSRFAEFHEELKYSYTRRVETLRNPLSLSHPPARGGGIASKIRRVHTTCRRLIRSATRRHVCAPRTKGMHMQLGIYTHSVIHRPDLHVISKSGNTGHGSDFHGSRVALGPRTRSLRGCRDPGPIIPFLVPPWPPGTVNENGGGRTRWIPNLCGALRNSGPRETRTYLPAFFERVGLPRE